jgi:hypothetical protein
MPATPLPDFDTLVDLHAKDPAGFEQFRRRLLREAVDSAPAAYRPALESLLCRIEVARGAAATPMDAAMVAYGMMQDSLALLSAGWEQARGAVAGWQTALVIERARRG